MFKNEFFKKYLWVIVIGNILSMTVLCLFLIKTNYSIIVPGPTTNLDTVINIKDSSTDTNIYSVSVMEYNNASVLETIFAKMYQYALVEEQSSYVDTSTTYMLSSGTVQKNVSITNALIAGYSKAGKPLNYEFKGYIVHSLYGDAYKYFKIGDIITGYQGIELEENLTLTEAIYTYESKLSLVLGQEYPIDIIRNDEEMTVSAYPFEYISGEYSRVMLGISMYAYYELEEDYDDLFTIDTPSSTGPSAGLAMGLYVYDQVSGSELTKDLKIVTTGTIEINGDVGTIGGIQAKVISALSSQADVFFVPETNYEEAMIAYNKVKNPKTKIVPVETLQDVIEYLESLR